MDRSPAIDLSQDLIMRGSSYWLPLLLAMMPLLTLLIYAVEELPKGSTLLCMNAYEHISIT